jgi:hypothetical protein
MVPIRNKAIFKKPRIDLKIRVAGFKVSPTWPEAAIAQFNWSAVAKKVVLLYHQEQVTVLHHQSTVAIPYYEEQATILHHRNTVAIPCHQEVVTVLPLEKE